MASATSTDVKNILPDDFVRHNSSYWLKWGRVIQLQIPENTNAPEFFMKLIADDPDRGRTQGLLAAAKLLTDTEFADYIRACYDPKIFPAISDIFISCAPFIDSVGWKRIIACGIYTNDITDSLMGTAISYRKMRGGYTGFIKAAQEYRIGTAPKKHK